MEHKNIREVTGGQGGSVYLVLGVEKTAVIDTGMAYCALNMVKNIEQILKDRPLDYIFLSHSHYDHIAGTPYLKKRWPQAKTVGMEYTQTILSKESALSVIRDLTVNATEKYTGNRVLSEDYEDIGLAVDLVAKDGDIIDLGGGTTVQVLHTPGHTKDTCSYFLEKESVFFSGETFGVITEYPDIFPSFLVSYQDTIDAIEKCRAKKSESVICAHAGYVKDGDADQFFVWAKDCAEKCRDLICAWYDEGLSFEEIMQEYTKEYRNEYVKEGQPLKAFLINAQATIDTVLKEFRGN